MLLFDSRTAQTSCPALSAGPPEARRRQSNGQLRTNQPPQSTDRHTIPARMIVSGPPAFQAARAELLHLEVYVTMSPKAKASAATLAQREQGVRDGPRPTTRHHDWRIRACTYAHACTRLPRSRSPPRRTRAFCPTSLGETAAHLARLGAAFGCHAAHHRLRDPPGPPPQEPGFTVCRRVPATRAHARMYICPYSLCSASIMCSLSSRSQ
jgi:hypothetical protein